MNIEVFHFGPLRAACMVLWAKGPDCFVVDACFYAPGEKESLYGFLKEKGLKPAAILLTHTHFDHIHGVEECSRDFGGLTVYYSEADRGILADREKNCRFLGLRVPGVDFPVHYVQDGEQISIPGLTLEVLATPGHTPGCVCYLDREGKILISGDTLFAGTIGRTDLGGGDYDLLMDSIQRKILPLDGEIEVYPGHGPSTSIGVERRSNPFLQPFNSPDGDDEAFL